MKAKGIVAILLLGLLVVSSVACGGGTPPGKIAFVSNRDGNNEIYVMDADGSNQTNLTNNAADDIWPAWSPDGSKIAFMSDSDGSSEIYVMDADGANCVNLTNHPATDALSSWSPDGTKIVFYSDRDGNREIYVMNVDGSDQTRLTDDPSDDTAHSWSPDGTTIAFHRTEDSGPFQVSDLWVMDADGSNQIQLTSGCEPFPGCAILDATWLPDGKKIVFASGQVGIHTSYDIYVVDADGSKLTRLTPFVVYDTQPALSPDGKKIAFVSIHEPSHPDPSSNADIWVMDVDGFNQTQLTDDPAWEYNPTWSPDGTKIAFESERARKAGNVTIMGGRKEIYVMDADGSNQTRLTDNEDQDYWPEWAP